MYVSPPQASIIISVCQDLDQIFHNPLSPRCPVGASCGAVAVERDKVIDWTITALELVFNCQHRVGDSRVHRLCFTLQSIKKDQARVSSLISASQSMARVLCFISFYLKERKKRVARRERELGGKYIYIYIFNSDPTFSI